MKRLFLAFNLVLIIPFVWSSPQNYDEPLILTRYLERGDILGGQDASRVEPLVDGVESYSGFFTVEPKYDSNMFFWYFPSNNVKAPVVIWLQGGPGASSMFGLFYENGPLMLKDDHIVKREYSWSKVSNLIFIDNPVGAGFSFTNSSDGFVTNQEQVGSYLYSTILQFFTLFPHLQGNELYITGESYAGKYVPATAYTIHKNNPSAKLKLNLKGVASGAGYSDPINMFGYGEYLYQIGLIDMDIKVKFETDENYIKNLIVEGKYDEAYDMLMCKGKGSLMANVTGINTYYNYVDLSDDGSDFGIAKLFKQDRMNKRIHVGNISYGSTSGQVYQKLSSDIMKSVAPWFKIVADNYRVIVYNGQFDIIVAYPLTVNFLRNLDWCGHDEYMKTPRKLWLVNEQLAGYSRTVKPKNCNGSLTEVFVRNAGHSVPKDQPAWAFDIITRLVNNEDF